MKDYNSDSTVVLDRLQRHASASARRPPNVSNVARLPGVMPMTPRANMPHGVLRTIPTSRKTTDPSTSARAVRPAVPDMARPAFGVLPGPSGRAPFGSFGRLRRRAFRGGGSSASLREETLRCAEIRRQACLRAQIRRQVRAQASLRRAGGGFPSRRTCGGAETLRSEVRGRIQARRLPRRGSAQAIPGHNPNVQTGEIRLNRFIAQSGLCSRREADDYIQAGLVSVNGVIVTELGSKVKPTDEVKFNDSRIEGKRRSIWCSTSPKAMSLRSKIPTPTRR